MTNNNENKLPLVSIITIVLNGEDIIEKTILSIIEQTYQNIEYIIVDGKSSDNTINIIKKYEQNISKWISEKDQGLYDAMNKGTALATGEWIIFMNAGDSFYDRNVLEKIFSKNLEADLIYGKTKRIFPNYEYIKNVKPLKDFWRGMRFCHQSMFVKSNLQKENLFSLNTASAEYEFVYKMYLENKKFSYFPLVISNFAEGGASTKSLFKHNYLNYLVSDKLKKLTIKQKFFYFGVMFLAYVVDIIRKIFPNFLEKFYKIKTLKKNNYAKKI